MINVEEERTKVKKMENIFNPDINYVEELINHATNIETYRETFEGNVKQLYGIIDKVYQEEQAELSQLNKKQSQQNESQTPNDNNSGTKNEEETPDNPYKEQIEERIRNDSQSDEEWEEWQRRRQEPPQVVIINNGNR